MPSEENIHIALAIIITLVAVFAIFLLPIFNSETATEILKTEIFQTEEVEKETSVFEDRDFGLKLVYPIGSLGYDLEIIPNSANPEIILLLPQTPRVTNNQMVQDFKMKSTAMITIEAFNNQANWSTQDWLNTSLELFPEVKDSQPQWFLYEGRQMAWLEGELNNLEYNTFLIPSRNQNKIFAFSAISEVGEVKTKQDLMKLIEEVTIY